MEQTLSILSANTCKGYVESIGKVISNSSDYARKIRLVRWHNAIRASGESRLWGFSPCNYYFSHKSITLKVVTFLRCLKVLFHCLFGKHHTCLFYVTCASQRPQLCSFSDSHFIFWKEESGEKSLPRFCNCRGMNTQLLHLREQILTSQEIVVYSLLPQAKSWRRFKRPSDSASSQLADQLCSRR